MNHIVNRKSIISLIVALTLIAAFAGSFLLRNATTTPAHAASPRTGASNNAFCSRIGMASKPRQARGHTASVRRPAALLRRLSAATRSARTSMQRIQRRISLLMGRGPTGNRKLPSPATPPMLLKHGMTRPVSSRPALRPCSKRS